MLLHTRRHSEHIGIENDIQRIHANFVDEQMIGPFRNLNATFITCGLTCFIEAHHHHRCAITLHITSMLKKLRLALLQRNGVDNALALYTFKASLNHLPIRGVYHHGYTGNIGLCSDTVQEIHHLRLRIEQTVIHIDINHECSVSHLLTGNAQGLIIVLLLDES